MAERSSEEWPLGSRNLRGGCERGFGLCEGG